MFRITSARMMAKMAAPRMSFMPHRFIQMPTMMRTFSMAAAPITLEVQFRNCFEGAASENNTTWLCNLINDCFLKGPMTFDQHRRFNPIIDEIIFYVA